MYNGCINWEFWFFTRKCSKAKHRNTDTYFFKCISLNSCARSFKVVRQHINLWHSYKDENWQLLGVFIQAYSYIYFVKPSYMKLFSVTCRFHSFQHKFEYLGLKNKKKTIENKKIQKFTLQWKSKCQYVFLNCCKGYLCSFLTFLGFTFLVLHAKYCWRKVKEREGEKAMKEM